MPAPSDPDNWGELPQFRTLRRMVTILTATLTIGVLTIAATLVIRILTEDGPGPATDLTAEAVSLPAAAEILAVGATPSALTIAVRDEDGAETLRVFHPKTGALMSTVVISRD
ncbi:MAG: DUF6476 family protein [Pseudomonadota bacterium]